MHHPKTLTRLAGALSLVVLSSLTSVHADVTLPSLFSEHAALQASTDTPVWGKADPGEAVRVKLGNASAQAEADASGRWRAGLDLRNVGPGPFELVVEGRNRLVVSDVVVGQVWVCSGQSNMEWPLSGIRGGADEYPNASNPMLRHFKVEKSASAVPLDDVRGSWAISSPYSVPNFSAVGYFFGQKLQHVLGVPVGLINTSWGGTPVEAWTRTGAFDTDPDLKAGAETARREAVDWKAYLSDYAAWVATAGREDHPYDADALTAEAARPDGWKPVNLPSHLRDAGLPDAGAVWLVKKITLPESAVGAGLQIFFGDVRDSVTLYWNDVRVAGGGPNTIMHRYGVHSKHVTSTEGVLAARIYAPLGGAGIDPGNARFRIDYRGGSQQLAGEWLAKAEYAFTTPVAAAAPVRPAKSLADHHLAGYLFDGMVRPLIPAGIAGVLWYQGEQNWDRGWQYRTAFSLMISDWRAQWGRGDFPFYFCQLPNYGQPPSKPGESNWAEVRESQAAALALPNTGMAVLIDVGEAGNIHPSDKRSVGDRLALARTYGRTDIVDSGPQFASARRDGKRIIVSFKNSGGGLAVRGEPSGKSVDGFMICGEDGRWQWAEARIEGDIVAVWSDAVPEPAYVRYAWADNPKAPLCNQEGLPAAPFRTDDFPASSRNRKY